MQTETDNEHEAEKETLDFTIRYKDVLDRSDIPKLEIPFTIQDVIAKTEQAQLHRAREGLNMELSDIMHNVQRILNRYTVDEHVHSGRKIFLEEHKKRRTSLLEKLAAYIKSADIKDKTLADFLAWLEEWHAILSGMTAIDIDEHYHWIAQMEMLPETFKSIENSVKILSRISTSLLEEKRKQKKTTASRGSLWKSWKERVIKRPAAAHALRPDQMISDEFATNTKVSEIQDMLQELIGTAMFNKLENNAIKYISATIGNLSKALSTLNDEVKFINLQSANMYINETSEGEKEISLKIVQDLSEKNEMLQQKLQEAEEKYEQLIQSKGVEHQALPTSTLEVLSEPSPQSSMAVSQAHIEDSINNILSKEFKNTPDEVQRKGTKPLGIKWDSAISYTDPAEMISDLTDQQYSLPEKKQKKSSEDITEDKISEKKGGAYEKDETNQYQSQKGKHVKGPPVPKTSESSPNDDKGKHKVAGTKPDHHFELPALEEKRKERKSFSEAKSKSSTESKSQHADFPSTDTKSQGGKSGTSSLWEQLRKAKPEYSLSKSQISSGDKEELTTESTDKEGKHKMSSLAEPFRLSQLDYSSEKLKIKGKKHQTSPGTTASKEEKTEEKDMLVSNKKVKSYELVKLQPRTTKETSDSTRALGSPDSKSEQNNLEEFQKAIMAFLKEKTDNIGKPLDKKTVPKEELLLNTAEVEKLGIIKTKMEEYFQKVAESVTKILRKYKDIKNAGQVGEKPMKQKKEVSFMPGLHFQKPISAKSEISALLSHESLDPLTYNLIQMILTEIESERDVPVASTVGRDHKEKEKQRQEEYLQEGQRKNFGTIFKHHLQGERSYETINQNLEKEGTWLPVKEGKQRQQKQIQWKEEEEVWKEQQKQRMQKQIKPDEKQKQGEEEREGHQKPKQQHLETWKQKIKEQGVLLEREKRQQMLQVQEVRHLEQESSWEREEEKQKPRRKVEDYERQSQKTAKDQTKTSEELEQFLSQTSVTLPPMWKSITKDAFQLQQTKKFKRNLKKLEILEEGQHPIPITPPTFTESSSPRVFSISGQSPTKSINLTPQQAQAIEIDLTPEETQTLGITPTSHQFQALEETPTSKMSQGLEASFTPEQAQVLRIPITPEQAKEEGTTVTPEQAQAQGITLTPQQAQALGVTLIPEQVQAQGTILTPQQAQALGVTLTPEQAQAQRINLTPQQAQALRVTLTPEQAHALGVTLTPEQPQAQGITLTPQQAQVLGVTLTPQQAQAQGTTLTSEQAQALGVTLTPEQAQAQGISLTPQQAQVLGVTLTPQQAHAQGITLTPQQAQAQGVTLTPEQAQAQGITLTPQQAQVLGVTFTPQQAQAQRINLTPQQAQALRVTLTPEQAQALGVTLTPEQAQAQGTILTPQQAQALGVTLTPEQAQAQGITLTPQQAQALRVTLTPEQAQALGVTLTLEQAQAKGTTLTPQQAQALGVTLTPEQAQAQGITLTPQQAQALGVRLTLEQPQAQGITLTPQQAQALRVTLTPEQAQALGVTLTLEQAQAKGTTLTPQQAQALGVTLTPEQAQAQGITLTPQQAQALGVTLTPEQPQAQGITLTPQQAQALRVTLTPEQAQALGVTLTLEQAQAKGTTLTPQQAQALGVTLTPEQPQAQGITLNPQQAQALGVTLTPEQPLAQRISLTPQQAQGLGVPFTLEQAQVLQVSLSPEQFGELGAPLISDKVYDLESPHTPEQIQLLGTPFTPGQARSMGITLMSEQGLKSRPSLINKQPSRWWVGPPSGYTLGVEGFSIADKSVTASAPHIPKQSPATPAPVAEKSTILEVSSTPLLISGSPLTQAPLAPGKSVGMRIPSDPGKLLAPQTFPSSRQNPVSKGQSTSVQLPTPVHSLVSGFPPIPGQPLALEALLSSRQFLISKESLLTSQSPQISKLPVVPRQSLISGVLPTSAQIPSVWAPLSPGKPLVPGASSIPGGLLESGPLTLSEQPQVFQTPATNEQSPYLQAPFTLRQHLAPATLPGQTSSLWILPTPGSSPTLWVPSIPAKPQKDLSSPVSKKSKERLLIISSLKSKSALVHPSASNFKVSQAPFTTKKFPISEVSDTSKEIQIPQDPFAMEQPITFQSCLTDYRTPVSQTPDKGELPTLMKPVTSLPSLTILTKTSQSSLSEWDQKSRFPPIDKSWILTSVSGTKKSKIMAPTSYPQELKEKYFVDVEAQGKNLILLSQATKASGLPSQLHTTARNLIIETLHTDAVRLGYVFRKYIAYRLIQRARNNIIQRLLAIQNTGKGYETQNLYVMLNRIDDYQEKVMQIWTEKQKSLEQKRNQCLRKMMYLFSQLQEIYKLNLSQPIPLIINKKQIHASTKFVQRTFLELQKEEDRKYDIFKKFRQEDQIKAIWNADLSTSSYPITEKTPMYSFWAQLGGFPDIPMLLQLDVQSTFRRSLACLQSKFKKIPRLNIFISRLLP
ncbi:protein FAM186A isoform X2 [Vicugna pacos]|uniref:Protein FAM186A isoform X2 n=1 Tax=Vicugna pacos TaxID=30538 RepID=A0ABM5E6Z0_VICPA